MAKASTVVDVVALQNQPSELLLYVAVLVRRFGGAQGSERVASIRRETLRDVSSASSHATGVSSPFFRTSGVLIRSSWFTNEKPNRPFTHNIPRPDRLLGSSSTSKMRSSESTFALIPHPTPQNGHTVVTVRTGFGRGAAI